MRTLVISFLVLSAVSSHAQQPELPANDRIRIAEAFALADDVQDQVWPGWSEAPFAVLLVTQEHEFLIRHPRPSDDFLSLGYDSLLESSVYVRPRTFSTHLQATFPAVGGVPTVVIGQPENTGLSSTRWVTTVMHEHFHQLQVSHPDYWDEVQALDLSGGDETGMWMLDYPFPYDSTAVVEQFAAYRDALRHTLESIGSASSDEAYERLTVARSDFRHLLSDADYRYISFQLWQEGVARYIEYLVAETAAEHHAPLPPFESLSDFTPYDQVSNTMRQTLTRELRDLDLAGSKRLAFYPAGAVEAMLLDVMQPDWKGHYFDQMSLPSW